MALSDLSNALTWLGIAALIVGGLLAIYLARARGAVEAGKYGGTAIGVGVVALVVAWLINVFLIGSLAVAPPPPAGGSVTLSLAGGSIGTSGVTWNSQAGILTVDLVWNETTSSNYFCIEASNATCGPTAGHTSAYPNYLLLPFTLSRSDASNVTYGFTSNVASIPTYQTVSTPTTYSVIGYKPATGTSNGQWQVKWNAGSNAGVFPAGAAPTTVSNLISTLLGVKGFSSGTESLQVSLQGSNSTGSAVSTANALFTSTTLQQFVANPMTLTFQNANPGTVTVNFIVIGQHL